MAIDGVNLGFSIKTWPDGWIDLMEAILEAQTELKVVETEIGGTCLEIIMENLITHFLVTWDDHDKHSNFC